MIAGDGTPVIGPGRVTRHLKIDRALNGMDATRAAALRIEDRGIRIPARRVRTGPRIGIDFAGPEWAAKRWRFWIEPAKPGASRRR